MIDVAMGSRRHGRAARHRRAVLERPAGDPSAHRARAPSVCRSSSGHRPLLVGGPARARGGVAGGAGGHRLLRRGHRLPVRPGAARGGAGLRLPGAAGHHLLRLADRGALPPRHPAVRRARARRRSRVAARHAAGRVGQRRGQHLRRPDRGAPGHPSLHRRALPLRALRRHGRWPVDRRRVGAGRATRCSVPAGVPHRRQLHGRARRPADGQAHPAGGGPPTRRRERARVGRGRSRRRATDAPAGPQRRTGDDEEAREGRPPRGRTKTEEPADERAARNVIDAAASGAADGLRLARDIGAMLLAFISLIALAQPVHRRRRRVVRGRRPHLRADPRLGLRAADDGDRRPVGRGGRGRQLRRAEGRGQRVRRVLQLRRRDRHASAPRPPPSSPSR